MLLFQIRRSIRLCKRAVLQNPARMIWYAPSKTKLGLVVSTGLCASHNEAYLHDCTQSGLAPLSCPAVAAGHLHGMPPSHAISDWMLEGAFSSRSALRRCHRRTSTPARQPSYNQHRYLIPVGSTTTSIKSQPCKLLRLGRSKQGFRTHLPSPNATSSPTKNPGPSITSSFTLAQRASSCSLSARPARRLLVFALCQSRVGIRTTVQTITNQTRRTNASAMIQTTIITAFWTTFWTDRVVHTAHILH